MKNFIPAAAAASFFLATSFGGASALPIKPIDPVSGAFAGSSPSGGGVLEAPLPTDLDPVLTDANLDYFGFYIPFKGSYRISAYVGADISSNVDITSFLLYNSEPSLLPGSAFAAAMYKELIPGKYIALKPLSLAKGLYYLGVGAFGTNVTPPSGYSGTLSVVVSTVPLPASAPMFGAALVAFGTIGYGLRRKKFSPTAQGRVDLQWNRVTPSSTFVSYQ